MIESDDSFDLNIPTQSVSQMKKVLYCMLQTTGQTQLIRTWSIQNVPLFFHRCHPDYYHFMLKVHRARTRLE